MKLVFLIAFILVNFISLFYQPTLVLANSDDYSDEKYLNIATLDFRPISVDRLLYEAFQDIGYKSSYTTETLITGYNMSNGGEKDGVISFEPNINETYENLIKVPVPLKRMSLNVFVREDETLYSEITKWEELSGKKVGVNTQRSFITDHIPSDAIIIEYDTVTQVIDGLVYGYYDIAILPDIADDKLNLRDGIVQIGMLGEFEDFLYLNKKHKDIIPKITEALENIFSDGRDTEILNTIPVFTNDRKKTILHILSSNIQIAREELFIANLRDRFEDDLSIEWYTVELNSRRFSRSTDRWVYFASLLRQDSVAKNIAAIVVSGETALEFLAEYYRVCFRNVPVFFYGVSNDYTNIIEDYEGYYSGIVDHISAFETVETALSLFPNTKNLYIINDYTIEGKSYRRDIENQLVHISDKINIEYNENVTNDILFEHIRNLSDDTLVLVGSYFSDATGQYFSQNEVKRLLERDCNVPVFSLHSTTVEYNALGGKSLDYEQYGIYIADILRMLLDGENIDDLSVINGSIFNRWVFDRKVMDRLNIHKSFLPENAEILNEIPSVWESDPLFAFSLILLVVITLTILIIVSIIFVQKHKKRELKERDKRIREVKERLERVISTAPVSYAMSVKNLVVEINENMKKDVGIDINDNVYKIYANPSQYLKLVERVMRNGFIKNEILKLHFSDGQIHRCLVNMTHTDYNEQSAIVTWIVDIERDQVKRDQLDNARHTLQIIIDTMPAPVGIVDPESMTLTYGNEDYLKLFEFKSFDDLQGSNIHGTLIADQNDETYTIGMNSKSDETIINEIKSRTVNGKLMDIRILTRKIDYGDKTALICILTDLAQEKEFQRMLFSTAEKEREANQLKGRFLVNMSHEIRTPMNAIIGLTEIELRKKLDAETKEIYKKINISAKNLLEIINDILDLSKIEADKLELFEDEFELEDVLNSALLVATPRLDGKNVELLLNAALDLPRFLIGDKTRLWQILKNFLDNSAKFTESGKIVLTVYINDNSDDEKATLSFVNDNSDDEKVTLSFVIEDTGYGIDETQMQKLFDPYEQIHNEAQKRYSGTGLGMSISKQLCEIMGGNLKVESQKDVGTTIYMNIPFKRSKNNNEIISAKEQTLSGIDILAIDDDSLSLDIMTRLLENNGASCVTAKSGTEAMDIIIERSNSGKPFDLILLDYMMQNQNGLETAKQIHLALSRVPKLLMVTAYEKLLLKSELEKNGIDSLIEKPFIPTQFVNKLCASLGYETNDTDNNEIKVFMQFNDVHVLLCEDYQINQEVASGMFSQFNITCTIAENGQECIDILNSGKTFDLIFMDLQMPIMDGYEATQIIRANKKFDKIPIISLTADAMKEIVDKCLQMGMNDHVAKPIEFDHLESILKKWIPKNKRANTSKIQEKKDVVHQALVRFGGNKEKYESALLDFAQILPDEWQSFESAINVAEQTKAYVHKIKGAAGNLSLDDIYKYATDFEASLVGSSSPDRKSYEYLINASNTFKKLVSKKMNKEINAPRQEGTVDEFVKHLNSLEKALENCDLRECSDIVKLLKEKDWNISGKTNKTKLLEIYDLTKKYEFDAALDIVHSILENSILENQN